MRLTILSKSAGFYTVRRIAEAARRRGHTVHIVDPMKCALFLDGKGGHLLFNGRPFPQTSLVLPRLVPSNLRHGLAVLEELEAGGVPVMGSSLGVARSHDRLRSLAWLACHGVGVPETVLTSSGKMMSKLVGRTGGPPVVLRTWGSGGKEGAMICVTQESMQAAMDALFGLGHEVVAQQYVRGEQGLDVRAMVIGGRVAASARRRPERGRFKRALGRGASFEECALSEAARQAAEKAASLLELGWAAVDLMETEAGVKVLEVNSTPSLQSLEGALRRDLAEEVVMEAERRAAASGAKSSEPSKSLRAKGRRK